MRATGFGLLMGWVLGLGASGIAVARVIEVPSEHPSVQGAIDAAAPSGDVILVSPGVYRENLRIEGKGVHLRSLQPRNRLCVETTILDGNSTGSVITLSGSTGGPVTISGFTITNGLAVLGGGIRGGTTDTLIQYNDILDNRADAGGGIAECNGSIQWNRIEHNRALLAGGLFHCKGTIEKNVIYENEALVQASTLGGVGTAGGGLLDCTGTIQYNRILANFAGAGNSYFDFYHRVSASATGGGLSGCDGLVRNNVIAGNVVTAFAPYGSSYTRGPDIDYCAGILDNDTLSRLPTNCDEIIRNSILGDQPQLVPSGDGGSTPTFCCIPSLAFPGEGNISDDPRFLDAAPVDPILRDYHVLPNSPTIDAGNPDAAFDDACLPPGQETARNDMGAYGGPGNCGWVFVLDEDFVPAILGKPLPPEKSAAIDQNGDGIVDISDLFRYWNGI